MLVRLYIHMVCPIECLSVAAVLVAVVPVGVGVFAAVVRRRRVLFWCGCQVPV